ncbi:MAG: YebC/PmpR family DNA-binding transcriptional regulator [Microscillaceae bacterium]|jgi:YebC/PmpR family DNA-binding regulatory protein|nr:YebC/PmpR family DNA-binding transcriptional regulator [Microscillaceae bacterium]
MAGHSKWAQIKRKKGANDAKRGKIFTKILKEITVAVKLGLPDPNLNARLRLAIQNAKGVNMPKENIERAIKKAVEQDSSHYTEVSYEAYAPHGVALFVECMTDNPTRTVANIRHYLNKHHGTLAVNGSVDFLFERKSQFTLPKPHHLTLEDFELQMIDAGAEDFESDGDFITITAAMEDFGLLQKALDDLKIEAHEAGLYRLPTTQVNLNDEQFAQVMRLIEKIEDDDDVQKVYHNLAIAESQLNLEY